MQCVIDCLFEYEEMLFLSVFCVCSCVFVFYTSYCSKLYRAFHADFFLSFFVVVFSILQCVFTRSSTLNKIKECSCCFPHREKSTLLFTSLDIIFLREVRALLPDFCNRGAPGDRTENSERSLRANFTTYFEVGLGSRGERCVL